MNKNINLKESKVHGTSNSGLRSINNIKNSQFLTAPNRAKHPFNINSLLFCNRKKLSNRLSLEWTWHILSPGTIITTSWSQNRVRAKKRMYRIQPIIHGVLQGSIFVLSVWIINYIWIEQTIHHYGSSMKISSRISHKSLFRYCTSYFD